MKCPYCGKHVKDIPAHLAENRKTCGAAHGQKLLADLDAVMRRHAAMGR